MREKIICGMSIFFLADKAMVPTEAHIPSGYSVSVEPVTVFDYKDREEFVQALWSTLERGNPDIDEPAESEIVRDANGFFGFRNPVELKYAGVKSWDDLEHVSIYASVCAYPSGYIVEVFGRSPGGDWSDEIVLKAQVPVDEGLGAVVDMLTEHMASRTDFIS